MTDTGIGIAADDISTALKPFGQVDGTLSRKYEGTGLGLPLTRAMVELHGGAVVIESQLDRGTNVIVRLGETISTERNYSGDTFRATLDRPIVLDGFVIADKGSKVLGKIVAADKAGKFEGTANLQVTLTEINTTDGQRVRIETGFFNRKGPSNTKEEAAKIGGGAVLGAIIGALAGGGKGAAIGAGAGGAAGTGAVALG